MTFWKWSTVAASNATADSTCPFPEGMDPAALNDGTRGMMAAAAKYRDDISGVLVTGGTSTAFTITSNQGFDSLAHMHGAMICFTPHVTNGASGSSLNVDGLGVKPILVAPGAGLPGGVLVQGTPYAVTYNNTDAAFYLHGAGGVTGIPLGCGMDFWGLTAPSSMFAFPIGQAISRTTYAALFNLIGGTYGVGDGSTTFNLPDKRGRVSAAVDAGAGRLSLTIGQGGGEQNHTLTPAEMAPHQHSGSGTTGDDTPDHTHNQNDGVAKNGTSPGGGAFLNMWHGGNTTTPTSGASARHHHPFSFTTDTGTGVFGGAHNNMQPTIACNYIIRIL